MRAGRWVLRVVGACGICGLAAIAGECQSPEKTAPLVDRLERAAAAGSLDTEGLRPWHLKLDVQVFDAKGNAAEQGTIEEWWAAPGRYRKLYTMPSYTSTEVRTDAGLFRTKGAAYPPLVLDALLNQVVRPMQIEDDIKGSVPELRQQSFGKVELECIILTQPIKGIAFPPLGLFPTYCFDPGKDTLRISFDPGSQVALRNLTGTFETKNTASNVTLEAGGVKLGSAHVAVLGTVADVTDKLTPEADLANVSEKAVRISAAEAEGITLHKVAPQYPQSAKDRHVSGTVLLEAIIDRNGQIRHLKLISAPETDLAIASLAAVRQWTFKPYILNGIPTEVNTPITVKFTFGYR